MSTESTPNREQLIECCERGFTSEEHWRNRDSSGAHRQLGEAYALLKADCTFTVYDLKHDAWWVAIEFAGFDAFEYGRDHTESDTFYIPTSDRLDRADGKDWY